ncbi:putative mediator of RNA polymerase II transcription subunit 26 [Cydia amplana]|uniref:putative mediator of RNA polymerase II transcription subunit 26 n=1 Tax=Cydia amplana TaxID=1869771 RepID=UPI002FE5472B
MVSTLLHKCFVIFFILKCCQADENLRWGENVTKLYELISSAVKDGIDLKTSQLTRRIFVNDSLYQVHLSKLKDVNGIKMHNIVIKRSGPDINSTIYINNPLEAKLPHPFMSLEEFKNTLVQQQLKDREAFLRSKKKAEYGKMWADIKATAKLKITSTLPKQARQEGKIPKKTGSNLSNTNTKGKLEKVQEHKSNTTHIHKQSTKTNTVSKPSTAYFRVKLLDLVQKNPTMHRSPTNKADKNSINSKTMNVVKQTVTTKPSNVNKEQLSIVEDSKISTEYPSSTIDGITIKEELAASNDNHGLSTIDGKITSTVGEATKIDEDVWKGVHEKELTNIDDESEETSTVELTTEPSTTTTTTSTTTTLPAPTTTRPRWSKPRVLLGDKPEGASTSTTS